MAIGSRFVFPKQTALNASGSPLSGAKLYFYENETETPQDTYSDEGLTVANANPVVADSEGVFGAIFLQNAAYTVVLKTSGGTTRWTQDDVRGIGVSPETTTYVYGTTAALLTTFGSGVTLTNKTIATTYGRATAGDGGGGTFYYDSSDSSSADNGGTIRVDAQNRRWKLIQDHIGVSVKVFGAKGDNVTDDQAAIQDAIDALDGKTLFFPYGQYVVEDELLMSGNEGTRWVFDPGATIQGDNLTSGKYVLTLSNCQLCDIEIRAWSGANGVLIEQSGTGDSLDNLIKPVLWATPNRDASKPTTPGHASARKGVHLTGAASSYGNYFNKIDNARIFQFETSILVEDNANATFISTPKIEGYWYGIVLHGQECSVIGGFGHTAIGVDASNLTEFFQIGNGTDAARYNKIMGCAIEPGNFARAGLIQANAELNQVDVMLNANYGILNSGADNSVMTQQGVTFFGLTLTNNADQTANDEYTVNFFGDGTTSQAGAYQSGVRWFGGGAQTRHTYMRQDYAAGNFIIEQNNAGTVHLKAPSGQGIIIGDAAYNGNPLRLGSKYLWVDSSNRLRIKSSAPASDTDGVIVGTQS